MAFGSRIIRSIAVSLSLISTLPVTAQVEDSIARLEEFRSEKRNYFRPSPWYFQRRQLAEAILEDDPDHALANLELAEQFLEDFYRYFNAVTLPDNVRLVSEAPEVVSSEAERNSIFVDNPFDVEQIESQGGMVLSMAGRASAALEKAIPYLERAIAADEAPVEAYDHLMRVAEIRGAYDDLLPQVETMRVRHNDESKPWLYLGLIEHRLGKESEAARAFREAFDRMSSAERAVFDDLNRIRSPDEDSLFKSEEVVFWRSRDARRLTPVNERKIEHYARLVRADLLFREDRRDRPGWDTERGQIFVRYGPPTSDLRMGVPEETEVAGRDDVVVWDYGDFRFAFFDMYVGSGEYSLYAPPASAYSNPRSNASRFDYVTKARETFRETPERYDYDPPGEWIDMPFQAVAFRGEGGNADVYLNYGIPLEGQANSGDQRDVEVSLETGAFVVSDGEVVVERRRTLESLPRNHLVKIDSLYVWASSESLAIVPGSYEVSFEAQTADEMMWGKREVSIDVPNFSAGDLKMSQILLAYAVEPAGGTQPGAVYRDGLLIQPAPWGVYGTDDPIYLYFEIYGLGMSDNQTNYEVEAELRPKDDRGFVERIFEGREPGVSNAFPVQSDRADDSQYVILDATGQPPGEYTLTVRVEDQVSGQTVEQETALFLE